MIVKELIEILLREDQNLRVVVDGYESGFNEVKTIKKVLIKPNPHNNDNEKNDNWWDGEFKLTDEKDREVAIVLPRNN